MLNSTGSATSIFGYAGEQFDTTGLIYLRARYMQPTLGIFLTEDTVPGNAFVPRGLHIYAYAWNNPVNLRDPSGNQVPVPCDLGGICATSPIGPYVVQTPPVVVQYVPNPPPPELIQAPTGFVSGFSSTADLAPWGIHTTDVHIGKQVQCGNGMVAGRETVWDIRHLQKATFKYTGITQDLGSLFGGWPAQFYTGMVFGFKDSILDYKGWFMTNELIGGPPGIAIGGMWAVGLDDNGDVSPDAVRANYGILSFGAGVGSPVGGGTSYTFYQRTGPIAGVPIGQSWSRHDRAILAEIFARDIESSNFGDQTAQFIANLARVWGQFDAQ